MTAADCSHKVKARLVGYDARLWRCTGDLSLTDDGCRALFVEGRTWDGEQPWIPLGGDMVTGIRCHTCLDGFCISLDGSPCRGCGAHSRRREVA